MLATSSAVRSLANSRLKGSRYSPAAATATNWCPWFRPSRRGRPRHSLAQSMHGKRSDRGLPAGGRRRGAAGGLHLQHRRQRPFSLVDTTERVFRKVWEMACYAGFLTGREAARLMLPHDRGAIFFTGATASLRGGAGYAAFAAAKAGLRAVAQSAARELGPKQHPRRASDHRRRCGYRMGARADQGTRGRGCAAQFRSRAADASGISSQCVLATVSAASRCVDVREGYPAVQARSGDSMAMWNSISTSAARTPV